MRSRLWYFVLAGIMVLLASLCHAGENAAYSGKLDLFNDLQSLKTPQPIAIRELHDGNWLAGIAIPIWHLQRGNAQVLHIGYFQAWRALGGDPAYGFSAGTDVVGDLYMLANFISAEIVNPPEWLSNYNQWLSVDFYGGYRPFHGNDTHSWIYGIGGKVVKRWDLLQHH